MGGIALASSSLTAATIRVYLLLAPRFSHCTVQGDDDYVRPPHDLVPLIHTLTTLLDHDVSARQHAAEIGKCTDITMATMTDCVDAIRTARSTTSCTSVRHQCECVYADLLQELEIVPQLRLLATYLTLHGPAPSDLTLTKRAFTADSRECLQGIGVTDMLQTWDTIILHLSRTNSSEARSLEDMVREFASSVDVNLRPRGY